MPWKLKEQVLAKRTLDPLDIKFFNVEKDTPFESAEQTNNPAFTRVYNADGLSLFVPTASLEQVA
jgi:hypothetical protein